MQRTVYSTKFTYVKNTINEDNTISSEFATITVHETDEKKAYKKAAEAVGNFNPVKVEKIGTLYKLDDDIFFKYATPVEDEVQKDGE